MEAKNNIHDQYSDINFQRDGTEDIISRQLPFFVRWGTFFFVALLLMIAVISWIIKMPEIVVASGTMNSLNGPKEISAKNEGKLIRLNSSEGEYVLRGQVIGFIESIAIHDEVLLLSDSIDSILSCIDKGNSRELSNFKLHSFKHLGELQTYFQLYMQAFREFSNFLPDGFYYKTKRMLNDDLLYLSKINTTLTEQRNFILEDVTLADSNFIANKTLKDEKVISPFDYRNERSKVLAKQITLTQISSSIINNEKQHHDKQKEIAELENEIQHQTDIILQASNTFKSQIDDWKSKYLLIAPIEGKVSFSSFIQENQLLNSGQLVCHITPENSGYYVDTHIPQYNFGRVKVGQEVLVKVIAYPYHEFGTLRGKVSAINTIATDSGYRSKVELSSKLITNYNHEIYYRNGLTVHVEIITESKRLLIRLFERLKLKTNSH